MKVAACLLVFCLESCHKDSASNHDTKRGSTASTQGMQLRMRHRAPDLAGTAAVANDGSVTLNSFRDGAIHGKVGTPMTDGRVEVVIRQVRRKPYFNAMARGPTADYEYEAVFTIANRTSTVKIVDKIEGVMYSHAAEPIIRTVTCYHDKDYNVRQVPTGFAPGEFDEFNIPSMGREGDLWSVGVALKYNDKTESRFWIPVRSDEIAETSDDK